MRKIAGLLAVVAALAPALVVAQTVDPSTVSGTVIVDGNDFMQAQHLSNLITSGEALTQRNYQMMMSGRAAMGGGAAAARPQVDAAVLSRKEHELDEFAPSPSTVPHDIAARLAAGDGTKQARLQQLLGELLTKFNASTKLADKHYVSGAYVFLLLESYGVQGTLPQSGGGVDAKRLAGAMGNYVAAVQLASGRAASNVEKQRTFDTIAISTAVLDTENELASKRNDPQLKAKVQAQAAGTIKRMFGCSTESTPLQECIDRIGTGSAKVVNDGGYALLKL